MFEYTGKIADLPPAENHTLPHSEKRVVFGPDGRFSPLVTVRDFRIEPGVTSSPHKHPWSHLVTGIQGKGAFVIDGEDAVVEPGVWLYVPEDVPHYFENRGDEMFEFQCIVPPEGDVTPPTPV